MHRGSPKCQKHCKEMKKECWAKQAQSLLSWNRHLPSCFSIAGCCCFLVILVFFCVVLFCFYHIGRQVTSSFLVPSEGFLGIEISESLRWILFQDGFLKVSTYWRTAPFQISHLLSAPGGHSCIHGHLCCFHDWLLGIMNMYKYGSADISLR